MAATTISAILTRIETVLQADPLYLTLHRDPFAVEGMPNDLVNTSVRVVSGGIVRDTDQSNYSIARVERVIVTLTRTMSFAAYDAQRDLQDVLDSVEREVIADGPDNHYQAFVEKGSRKVTRKKDSDVIEASIAFWVDYDFSTAD